MTTEKPSARIKPALALLAALVLAAGFFSACGSSGSAAPGQKYVCPMHPKIISDKPGTCPICGMKLVPVKPRPTGTTAGGAAAATPAARAATTAPGTRKIKLRGRGHAAVGGDRPGGGDH